MNHEPRCETADSGTGTGKNGNWDEAHRIVQDISSRDAARVHAYLHRVEGGFENAQYWYSRSGEAMPPCSLDEERQELLTRFSG